MRSRAQRSASSGTEAVEIHGWRLAFDVFHKKLLEEFVKKEGPWWKEGRNSVPWKVATAKALNHTAAAIRRKWGRYEWEQRHFRLNCMRLVTVAYGFTERIMRLESWAEDLAAAAKANDWDYLRALLRWHDEAKVVTPDPRDVELLGLLQKNPKLPDGELARRMKEASAVAVRGRRLRLGSKKRGT